MAVLRFLDDDSRLQTKTLDSEQFLIGRADSCQLVFNDDMISREHVRIDLEREGRFRIRDLGSRNKTYVNGEVVTETILSSGDIIRVGDHILEYLDDSNEAERIDLEFLTPDQSEPPSCDWIKLKAPLSLSVDQVEKLSHLIGEQPLTARAEDIANAALSQMLLDLKAERGFIALRGESKTDLIPLAQRALKRPPGGSMVPVSQNFALAPLLQGVAGRYPQSNGKIDLKLGYASAAVVAPMTYGSEVIGILYVDRPASKKAFTSVDLPYCAAAAMQIGTRIAMVARKLVKSAVREGAAWMTAIRRTQTALTARPESSDSFEVAHRVFPGRSRCGDFLDVVHLDAHRCFLTLVDGGGHGMAGIAQASAILTAVRAALGISEDAVLDPSMMLGELNQLIAGRASRQVIPALFIGIDMASGKLAYANAGGMPPLLMIAPGRLITLDQAALVLGIDEEYSYESTRVDLPEQFRLICHTDGLTEAVSVAGEPMGSERLHELLLSRDTLGTAAELVDAMATAWEHHLGGGSPDDDASVVALARG